VARQASDGSASHDTLAWQVYQLDELFRRAERWIEYSLRTLAPAHERRPGRPFVLRHSRLAEIRHAAQQIERLAAEAQTHLAELPSADIRVAYEHAARGALRELALGAIYDAHRVVLAAQMGARRDGLAALASGLRATNAYRTWKGLTLKDLLKAFKGMTPQSVRLIATDVRLAPGDQVAKCAPAQINRLAARLEDYVHLR